MKNLVSTGLGVALAFTSLFLVQVAPSSAGQVTAEVVNVDFTTTVASGSTITNAATGSLANLTINGTPTFNATTGLTFPNSTAPTSHYLTGNLGSTTNTTQIVVEFSAKFPDAGCATQSSGSMVFSLGSSGSFAYYNIYRHSNFIGFNTFNSDIYGAAIPDSTGFHSYKFVMRPNSDANTLQEVWIDGTKQTPSYQTTSSAVSPCSIINGTGETNLERKFTRGSYSNGDFMFMTHALSATQWGTTGSVQNLKITTTNTTVGASAPGAPTIGSIAVGNAQLSVPFTPPASDGGASITDYKYSTDNGSTWISAASTTSPIVITGLTNGLAYNVKLRAVNSAGDGTASTAVSATPAVPVTTPGAPTIGSITAGDSQLSVPFTAPSSDGGAAITGYQYSTDNGSTWASSGSTTSPIVITGLSNGTAYNVKLRAVNSAGDGTASSAVSATPVQPQAPSSSSGGGTTPTPAPAPAQVESISVSKALGSSGSVLKVKLEPQANSNSGSSVKVRLLDVKGKLIQELTVAVTGATSVIEVPVTLAFGEFTVEAVAINASGSSQTIATQPTYVAKPLYKIVSAISAPVLQGKKIADPVFFKPDSAALTPAAKKSLLEVLAKVNRLNSRIAITGFTASANRGTKVEKKLAAARALEVAKFLKANGSKNWIYYAGFGALKSSKSSADARKVELRILN